MHAVTGLVMLCVILIGMNNEILYRYNITAVVLPSSFVNASITLGYFRFPLTPPSLPLFNLARATGRRTAVSSRSSGLFGAQPSVIAFGAGGARCKKLGRQ